jgi:DNA gyrase subunit A
LFARGQKHSLLLNTPGGPGPPPAAGVRGIRLPEGEEVISLIIVDEQGMVLTASQNGYGKRTTIEDFPLHGRGGQGVIALQISERNGRMVGALLARPDDEIMLISSGGTLVRTPVGEISVQGRNTQGVRLIRLDEGDRLVGLERIVADGAVNGAENGGDGEGVEGGEGDDAGEPAASE